MVSTRQHITQYTCSLEYELRSVRFVLRCRDLHRTTMCLQLKKIKNSHTFIFLEWLEFRSNFAAEMMSHLTKTTNGR